MSPLRDISDGLTEGEIRALVHREMRDALVEQNKLLEKIADGAQASIISANILHGNPEMNLKGAIPDLQERLAEHERAFATQGQKFDDRCAKDDDWRDRTDERLDALEADRHPWAKRFTWCWERYKLLRSEWKAFAGALAGAGVFGAGITLPSIWGLVHRIWIAVGHAIRSK